MKIEIRIVFALLVVGLLVPCQYVKAEQYDEIVQNVDFAAMTGANEVQNNMDDGSRNNYDTWDPIPQGVWFGGWAIESQLRLSAVPDTDFSMALANVCYFGSDLIMSGASRTLVRLPVHTSADPWTRAALDVYEIDQTTNWTFTRNIVASGEIGYSLNDMKVDFTTGPHELIFWSPVILPTDVSPTDGNDHYTRANRTYAFVDAPLKPDTYYLFITYVWYASDKYVEVYIQPDSLDSSGAWNRSTIATYNEEAPDIYDLEVNNFNVSNGYSFDFRHGFGNSAYAINVYMVPGDELEFFEYIDPDTIDTSHYLTFMLPYRSNLDNISWDITIRYLDPSDGSTTELMAAAGYVSNDFILISMEQTWLANLTAKGVTFDGWLSIAVEIQNETRMWFPVWDIGPAAGDQRLNSSWGSNAILNNIFDSGDPWTYNLEQFTQIQFQSGLMYNYHWRVQHSIQFNDFYWTKHIPRTSGTESLDPTENMTLTNKIIYGIGGFLIRVGDWSGSFNMGLGNALRAAGTAAQLVAVAGVIPDFAGAAVDFIQRIGSAIQGIGQWIWRAAQEVVGAIRWFVETVTYFVSIILGIIVFAFAVVLLMLCIWFPSKMATMVINGARGRREAAIRDAESMMRMGSSMIPRGGGN